MQSRNGSGREGANPSKKWIALRGCPCSRTMARSPRLFSGSTDVVQVEQLRWGESEWASKRFVPKTRSWVFDVDCSVPPPVAVGYPRCICHPSESTDATSSPGCQHRRCSISRTDACSESPVMPSWECHHGSGPCQAETSSNTRSARVHLPVCERCVVLRFVLMGGRSMEFPRSSNLYWMTSFRQT